MDRRKRTEMPQQGQTARSTPNKADVRFEFGINPLALKHERSKAMRYIARVLLLLVCSLCAGAVAFQTAEPALAQAPPTCPDGSLAFPAQPPALKALRDENSPLKIPNSYVVVLQPGTSVAIRGAPAFTDRLKAAVPEPARTYTTASVGYLVR